MNLQFFSGPVKIRQQQRSDEDDETKTILLSSSWSDGESLVVRLVAKGWGEDGAGKMINYGRTRRRMMLLVAVDGAVAGEYIFS